MPTNIVFILIDDMGWRDLACYGSSFYETPRLDAFARESMTFTDAYASCPVCSPTRASILTGKYPARVGVTNFIASVGAKESHPSRGRLIDAPYIDHLPLEELNIARALGSHGYQTWHVGKWHLGVEPYWPKHQGFDVSIGGGHWGMPRRGYFSPWGFSTLKDGPPGEYLTDRLTDEAISLIRGSGDKPFFLYLPYYAVHTPIEAKQDLVEKYRKKSHESGLDRVTAFEEGEYFPGYHKWNQRVVRRLIQSDPAYAAMVENLDWNIGRLLDALDEAGLAADTMVIFTSDNGGLATSEGSPTCNSPLAEGKGWMYEGGTRVPLMVRWPGVIEPGSRCDVPVTSPDFYPTILEAVELPLRPEQHVDGVSLVPLLRGAQEQERDAIFWHYPHYGNQGGTPGSSIRMGDYKLIEFFEDRRLELYNLRTDPGEESNRMLVEPELARQMHERLVAWRNEVEALIPEPNPDFVPRST